MKQLTIDTSTSFFAAALLEDDICQAKSSFEVQRDHSSFAMPAIVELFAQRSWTIDMIDEIIVTQGPGSYTGIRIGVTIAKTLAFTKKIPLIGVSTLHVLATNCLEQNVLIVPIIDAKRQEVFTGLYQYQSGIWANKQVDSLKTIQSLVDELCAQPLPVVFVGKDAQLFTELLLQVPNSKIASEQATDGERIAKIASQYPKVTDLHAFAPNYYKLSQAEADLAKRKEQEKHGM